VQHHPETRRLVPSRTGSHIYLSHCRRPTETSQRERQWRPHLLDTCILVFLPDGQRIVSSGQVSIRMLSATAGKTESTRHLDFINDPEINDDVWICGSDGELLLWIPVTHREHLHRVFTTQVVSGFLENMKPAWIFLLSCMGRVGLLVLTPR